MTNALPMIFSGSSNLDLARKVTDYLKTSLGKCRLSRFSDGEISVNIDESVRGQHCFVVQSTCPPANEYLMELLMMIDALKRASASDITAVIPYYGYARQDRKWAPREPITAKLVADLIETAGATRIVSLDLHAAQIQGFFDMPVDHLFARPVFVEDIRERFCKPESQCGEVVIVSPDAGGVERARAYAKRLGVSLAIIDKRRPKPGVAEVMNIIGDVAGKTAVIVDDMIDSAGTLTKAADAILANGAHSVYAYATHAVFSGAAIERIESSAIVEIVVTDSIPLHEKAASCSRIRVLSVSELIGEAINRVQTSESISSLFL